MSTEDRTGDDGFTDERFAAVAERLSTSFEAQAERFEPSHDAYARLAVAVAERSSRRRVQAMGWLRPLAVATTAVVVVAVGGLLVSRGGVQTLDTAPGGGAGDVATGTDDATAEDAASDTPTTTGDPTAVPDDEETSGATAADPPAEETVAVSTDQLDALPPGGTPEAAARSFLAQLELIGLEPQLDPDGGLVAVDPTGEVVARLAVAETEDGVVVTGATADGITIDELPAGPVDGALVVSGSLATGGPVTIEVRSASHPRLLATTSAEAGAAGQPASFAATVPVVGSEHAWVVVRDQGGVTAPFAAQLVTFDSTPDPIDYSVVRVTDDDPDGGLVVRDSPGITGERIGVIPPGTAGVRRGADLPVRVGDDVWWSVEPPGGQSGWVNSYFLASGQPVADAELQALGERASTVLPTLAEDATGVDLPFANRVPVAIGAIGQPQLQGDELRAAGSWDEARSLPLPPETGGPFEGTLVELHRLAEWSSTSTTIELRPDLVDPADAQAASAYFAGLASVAITADNPSGPWDRTHLYVEQTPAGPVIVGVVVELQRP